MVHYHWNPSRSVSTVSPIAFNAIAISYLLSFSMIYHLGDSPRCLNFFLFWLSLLALRRSFFVATQFNKLFLNEILLLSSSRVDALGICLSSLLATVWKA